MPIAAWYALAASPFALLLLVDGLRMLAQHRARRRLTAASLDHALTVRRLEVAKTETRGTLDALRADVTASDYGYRPEGEAWDEHVTAAIDLASATPIHDELAVEHLRRDLDQWGREGA